MTTTPQVPYTHFARFGHPASAEACAQELTATFDCLTVIDFEDKNCVWHLRAAAPAPVAELPQRHEAVEAIVRRHQGCYDGGETGYINVHTNKPVGMEDPGTQS